MSPEKRMQWLVVVPSTQVRHWGLGAHLDEELLAGGPLLPSKLARPGPVRAPSPPKGAKKCLLNTASQPKKPHIPIPKPRDEKGGLLLTRKTTGG